MAGADWSCIRPQTARSGGAGIRMDETSKHIRRQFVDSLIEVVDLGVSSLGRQPVAELLWELLVDVDAGSYRLRATYCETGGISLEYRTALGLERDLEKLLEVQGLMIELESRPPVMEALDIEIGGEDVDDTVCLGGRVVHESHDGVALDLVVDEEEHGPQLRELVETMRESGDSSPDLDALSSTFIPGSNDADDISVVEESSVVDDDESDDSIVDRLVDLPDAPRCRWSSIAGRLDAILLEVASVDGYGVLEFEIEDGRTQFLVHAGMLVDVRHKEDDRTGDDLVERMRVRGDIDGDELERARVLAAIHDITVQDALVDLGFISLRELIDVLRSELYDDLDRLDRSADELDELVLYELEQRPSIRLRRSSVGLVEYVVRRKLARVSELSSQALEEKKSAFSEGLIHRQTSPRVEVDELGLGERHRRFLEEILDEPRSLFDLQRVSNLRTRETIEVLIVLNELGFVGRRDHDKHAPMRQEIERAHRDLATQNHFELLGVHWAADDREVVEGYNRAREKFEEVSEALEEELADELEAVRQKYRQAYHVLSDAERRRAYRREEIDAYRIRNTLKVYRDQAESLQMREDKSDLIDTLRRIVELDRDAETARRQLEALCHARSKQQTS